MDGLPRPTGESAVRASALQNTLQRLRDHARALAVHHARHGVHGALRPAAFTGDPPAVGHGTGAAELSAAVLRYAAPEVAGRIAAPDARSDLYSLGAMFFETLTGAPPFTTDDRLALAYDQIATPAPPLAERLPDIAPPVAAIVARLLAKPPAERYATADSLVADLDRCIAELGTHAAISDFELDTHGPHRFAPRNHLYGRDTELATLADAYTRVTQGATVIVTVAGPPGVGKSSLVHDLRRIVTRRDGRFLSGTFDRSIGAHPYSALREAGAALVRQLLTRPDHELDAFGRRVVDALGEDASALVEAIPGIEQLTGPLPSPSDRSPTSPPNRLHTALAGFVDLLATPATPLVVALDDAQWAQPAMLDLITAATEHHTTGGLLMVACYRTGTPGADEALAATLARLRAGPHRVDELILGPLGHADLAALADDACGGTLDDPHGLADVLHAKSGGNPLYVHQLLREMVDDGDLAPSADRWQWDPGVVNRPATDNVIDLAARRVAAFPPATQAALAATACAGTAFTLDVAAAATGTSPDDALAMLAPAVYDGVLVSAGRDHARTFSFAHDRLHQVAAGLDPGRPRADVHLAIARFLHADAAAMTHDAHVINVVDQYAAATDLLDGDERATVGGLAITAGSHAYQTLAPARAGAYFELARQLLNWDDHHTAKWNASGGAALAFSIRDRHDEFAAVIADMYQHAADPIARVRVRSLEAVYRLRSADLAGCMRVSAQGLTEFGIPVPVDDPAEIEQQTADMLVRFRRATAGHDLVEWLTALPAVDDEEAALPLDLVAGASYAASFGDVRFANLLGVGGATYCIENANNDRSALMYTLFAQALIDREQAYREAADLLEVARQLDRGPLHNPWMSGRMAGSRTAFVTPWTEPIEQVLAEIPAEAARTSTVYDPMYAACQLSVAPTLQALLGRSLGAVLGDHATVVEYCTEHTIEFFSAFSAPAAAYAEALIGNTDSLTSLDGSVLRRADFVAAYAGLPLAVSQLRSFEIALHGLVGNYAEVLELAGDPVFDQVPPYATKALVAQWVGTAAARQAAHATGAERAELLGQLAARTDFLRVAHDAGEPTNVAHRLAILDAEAALTAGDPARAFELFGDAAGHARRHGWVIDEGYALVQQAQLGTRLDHPAYAIHLLYEGAKACWRTAGALALVRWARPATDAVRSERAAADGDPAPGLLDSLETEVIVRAVQALTVDVDPDSLCERLLGLAVDASGAERGAVVESVGDTLRVVARTPSLDGVPAELIRLTLHSSQAQYARPRAHDADLTAGDQAALGGRRPAAVLCAPVGWSDEPTRVLYLEHTALANVFTGERRNLVGWLAGHAGILLGHAELYSALEYQVAVRTRELSEAKNAAERATAAKSEFLAHMSHEVRTPMNAVLGLAEILQTTELDEFQREQLARLDRSGRLLMGILSDVLDFSRIEAGELELATVPFGLRETVRDVVSVVARDAASRGIDLVTDIADDVPDRLVGDPVRLGQVLLNLLANAVKFTLHGSVELRVRVAPASALPDPTDDAMHWLQAEVRDTGKGIAAIDLDRIFAPFQQVGRPSIQPNRSGSGLGLAIGRQVARLMGGDLTATSQLGSCSVFTLEWPARLDRRGTPRTATPSNATIAEQLPDVAGHRVLVVEDNDINREIVRHMLAPLEVEVFEASNGALAVTMLAHQRVDLVLMDCQMPVLDGYQATQRMRELGSDVPIIGVSAHVSVDDRRKALEAGMSDYLTKPIDVKLLRATVATWLDR